MVDIKDEPVRPPAVQPPRHHWMKRMTSVGLLVLTLTGSSLGIHAFLSRRQQGIPASDTAGVARVNLPVTLSANGTVQPERSINLSPKTSGVLKALLVKEGDRVEQGQILAYMDDINLQGQLTQAQGQLASARANLQRLLAGNRTQDVGQAQARLTEARAALRQAEQTFRQNQQLYQAGAVAQKDFNDALAGRDRAQAQVIQAQQALSLQQAGARPEEIAQARAEVLAATGNLQTIQAQLNDTVIRAPFAGVVTRKYADPGAFVAPTTSGSAVSSATSSSILALAARNQITVKVAEADIARVKLGQTANVQADAYPGKTFQGRVIQIAAQSTVEQNVTSFEVKLTIADPENLLRVGMNTSVTFQVGTLANALVIPTVAIVRQAEGTGVMLQTGADSPPRFQAITTGVTVGNQTVVQSGLQVGDRVLLSEPPGTQSGGGSLLPPASP